MHQSKAHVEFSRVWWFLKMFEIIFDLKNTKNLDKKRLFKGRFKISCFEP
jgi:hypothetical protein